MNFLGFLLMIEFIASIDGAKILMILPFDSKSHNSIHEATAKALASRGHQVTMFSPYPVANHSNIEWFRVGEAKDSGIVQMDIFESRKQSSISLALQYQFLFFNGCENLYRQHKVKSMYQDIEKKGKLFDVAIVDSLFSDCGLPIASLAANHTIYLSVVAIPQWIAIDLGIPYPTSTTVSFVAHFSIPSNFWERLESFVGGYSIVLFYKYNTLPTMQSIVDNYLPSTAPSIFEAKKNISFILSNDSFHFTPSRPSVPFVAHIGGIHLQKAKPLPQELEEFMESSGKNGVILFSFGSYFDTKLMPIEMRNVFVKVFARLQQKIIWKYHEPIKGISKNVKIVSWMPQRDILGHPKLRLFITHGGILSSMEVSYYGIPIIGIPLFGDQMHNIHRILSLGFGLSMDIENITEETLYSNIIKILQDNRYAVNAKKTSDIFQDTQNSPAETANYWIEYIIRHNGAAHLKNPMTQELNFFKYLQLDVIATVILIPPLPLVIFVTLLKVLVNQICNKKTKNKKKKKQ